MPAFFDPPEAGLRLREDGSVLWESRSAGAMLA